MSGRFSGASGRRYRYADRTKNALSIAADREIPEPVEEIGKALQRGPEVVAVLPAVILVVGNLEPDRWWKLVVDFDDKERWPAPRFEISARRYDNRCRPDRPRSCPGTARPRLPDRAPEGHRFDIDLIERDPALEEKQALRVFVIDQKGFAARPVTRPAECQQNDPVMSRGARPLFGFLRQPGACSSWSRAQAMQRLPCDRRSLSACQTRSARRGL